jgi:hypothetical protein
LMGWEYFWELSTSKMFSVVTVTLLVVAIILIAFTLILDVIKRKIFKNI